MLQRRDRGVGRKARPMNWAGFPPRAPVAVSCGKAVILVVSPTRNSWIFFFHLEIPKLSDPNRIDPSPTRRGEYYSPGHHKGWRLGF